MRYFYYLNSQESSLNNLEKNYVKFQISLCECCYMYLYVSVCVHGWASVHVCIPCGIFSVFLNYFLPCCFWQYNLLYLELTDYTVLVVQQTSGVHPSLLCCCSIQACCHTDFLRCRSQGSELKCLCWYCAGTVLDWVISRSLDFKVLKNKTSALVWITFQENLAYN